MADRAEQGDRLDAITRRAAAELMAQWEAEDEAAADAEADAIIDLAAAAQRLTRV